MTHAEKFTTREALRMYAQQCGDKANWLAQKSTNIVGVTEVQMTKEVARLLDEVRSAGKLIKEIGPL